MLDGSTCTSRRNEYFSLLGPGEKTENFYFLDFHDILPVTSTGLSKMRADETYAIKIL